MSGDVNNFQLWSSSEMFKPRQRFRQAVMPDVRYVAVYIDSPFLMSTYSAETKVLSSSFIMTGVAVRSTGT